VVVVSTGAGYTRLMTRSRAPRGGGGGLTGRQTRTASSRRWLERQLRDPYVAEAKRRGLRSRAAFKLIQLDDRLHFLRPGIRVLDLGAAPGGWTQVAADRVRAGRPQGGRVVALDLNAMESVAGAIVLTGDIREAATLAAVRDALSGPADVVLSDMAPATIGHAGVDHLRIMALAEDACAVAEELLTPGGAFICKVLQGGTEAGLLAKIKRHFATIRHVKPPASRSESAEIYLVALGFGR
jgi:23S rRNA (uridine2552-2'-O)-methyltransferase